MFKHKDINLYSRASQTQSSPRDYAGFGNRLAAEQQNSVASFERATRRCSKAFPRDAAPELADIALELLGVEVAPAPSVELPCAHCTPPTVPRQTRAQNPTRLPKAGEVSAWRREQELAAQELEDTYWALVQKAERFLRAEAALVGLGCFPAHPDIGPRAYALVRLVERGRGLFPDWLETHTQWTQPVLDGRAEARDEVIRACEPEEGGGHDAR